MIEVWKDIPGYEGLYQASNFGRIYSLDRIAPSGKPVISRILALQKNKGGYLICSLFRLGQRNKKFTVHRLVANTFLINDLNKPQVNHKNGIKSDNSLSNLEWNTRSENMLHSFRVLNRKQFNSDEKRKHISETLIRKYKNGEISKDRNNLHKAVIQLTINGEFVNKFKSVTDASVSNLVPISGICAVMRNKRNSAGGYKWKYA